MQSSEDKSASGGFMRSLRRPICLLYYVHVVAINRISVLTSRLTNYDGPVNYESFFGQMCPNFPLFFYSFFAKRFFYFEKNCTCYNITAVYYSHHPDMMVRTFFLQLREGKFLMWSSDWMMKTCMLLAGLMVLEHW